MQQYTPGQKRLLVVLCLFMGLLVSACQSTINKDTADTDAEATGNNTGQPEEQATGFNWIAGVDSGKDDSLGRLIPQIRAAYELASPDKDEALLSLARTIHLLDEPDIEIQRQNNWLYNTLQGIKPEQLDDTDYIDYLNLARDNFAIRENGQGVLFKLLSDPRVNLLVDRLEVKDQIKTHELSAEAYRQEGQAINSLRQLMALQTLITDPDAIARNHESIWLNLQSIEENRLGELAALEFDRTLAGWYQLAAAYKLAGKNIEQIYQGFLNWRLENPAHPAAQSPPINLELIRLVLEQKPEQIALMLPLKGRLATVGKAIRDGFFSAYFHQRLSGSNGPEVRFYDTSDGNIVALYEQAVAEGAGLVIGPLSKINVSALEKHELQVPTIALNYTKTHDQTVDPLKPYFYQFGLSLEDEARQVAAHAYADGKQYAMVIAADDDWSYRTAEAFTREWNALGGYIVARDSFAAKDDLSTIIKKSLKVTASEQRAGKLKQLFGQNLEFEPRRRNDLDLVFLVARSKIAQQIKPLLAFHYAGDVPVFATSQLYASSEEQSKKRDLSGITISTLPWVADDNPLKSRLAEHIKAAPNLERLHALGADIWLLHNRLPMLGWSPEQSIQGNTGELFLAKNKRIYRKQPFAEIIRGEAKLIPVLPLIKAAPEQGSAGEAVSASPLGTR